MATRFNQSSQTANTTPVTLNDANQFAGLTEKVSPVSADLLVLEDSAAAGAKRKVQVGNLGGGGGTTPGLTIAAAVALTNDNYAPTGWSTASVVLLSGDGFISGFDSGATVKTKILVNHGVDLINVSLNSVDSLAANRVTSLRYDAGSTSIVGPVETLQPSQSYLLTWETSVGAWRLASISAEGYQAGGTAAVETQGLARGGASQNGGTSATATAAGEGGEYGFQAGVGGNNTSTGDAGAGGSTSLIGGDGGNVDASSTAEAGEGGQAYIAGGNGGSAALGTAGAGGKVTFEAGLGGATTDGTAGSGGDIFLRSGAGGDSIGTADAGRGGSVNITAGNGGAVGSGAGGEGGEIVISGGDSLLSTIDPVITLAGAVRVTGGTGANANTGNGGVGSFVLVSGGFGGATFDVGGVGGVGGVSLLRGGVGGGVGDPTGVSGKGGVALVVGGASQSGGASGADGDGGDVEIEGGRATPEGGGGGTPGNNGRVRIATNSTPVDFNARTLEILSGNSTHYPPWTHTGSFRFPWVNLATDNDVTVNLAQVVNASQLLNGSGTLSFTNLADGAFGSIVILQDGTGGHTLTPGVNVDVLGSLSLDTAPNAFSVIDYLCGGSSTIVSVRGGGGTTDATAIHDNVSGEIAAITAKTSPVSADLFIIEDSAASNAKKRLAYEDLVSVALSSILTSGGDVLVDGVTGTVMFTVP